MANISDTVAAQARMITDRVVALPERDERLLIAIAGPPGAGKSTLAEVVVEALGDEAILMPMDGFHLDNRLLEPRGWLPRKGAPETFDFAGFAATLKRVKAEPSVLIPVFDRSREIAIAGAAEITPEKRIVVVEGNYLCLDAAPWQNLTKLWNFSVFLDVPMEELEQRLVGRWLGFGFPPDAARAKAMGNDIPNARRVMGARTKVDMVLSA